MERCNARAKSTGEQCKQRVVPGSAKCFYHGGATPAGIGSPHYKHGRWSKAVPARLKGRYEEMLADPQLLHLDEEVKLVDARVGDLLARVDTGESSLAWRRLAQLLDAHGQAVADGKEEDAAFALDAMLEVLGGSLDDGPAWADIRGAIELRRRLVVSETARINWEAGQVTLERAMAIIANLADVINRNVPDREARAAIVRDIVRLTHHK